MSEGLVIPGTEDVANVEIPASTNVAGVEIPATRELYGVGLRRYWPVGVGLLALGFWYYWKKRK